MLWVVLLLAAGFALTNGVHDAGNAIAAPVMTRAAGPAPAVIVAAVLHVVGALVVGTAVAATIAGIVLVPTGQMLAVLAAAVLGALAWSLLTLWWGLPCSSGHCLVGALAGAALADGGTAAVHWGGLDGLRPVGVVGSLAWLFLSSVLALLLAVVGIRVARRSLRRATRAAESPVRVGELAASAGLALAHGSNDAQKTMGIATAALLAAGRLDRFAVPFWVLAGSALLLSLGTLLGGWRVVRTLGRRIYRIRTLDGLVSQSSSGVIVLAASLLGAPISTTDVVAPAVVGVGSGERWRHVRWNVAGEIGLGVAGHPAGVRGARRGVAPLLEVGRMRRWFLPDAPDLLGLLGQQGAVTVTGVDALAAWAHGDPSAAQRVRTLEHEADRVRREVQTAITSAFVTPIEPEDVYELSERLDSVLNAAKDLVREAELTEMSPDDAIAEMADLLALGTRNLVDAFPVLMKDPDLATSHADAAVKQQRSLEHVYRRAMSALLAETDLREVTGRRELYRRCARIGDRIEGVAHRIWYSVVKES